MSKKSKKKNGKSAILIISFLIVVAIIVGVIVIINQNKEEGLYGKNVYAINNKDFYLYKENVYEKEEEFRGVKLLEYDNSNEEYAELYYVLYDYSPELGYKYTLSITDSEGNNLILNPEEDGTISGGIISKVRIKKIDLSKTITFEVTESYYVEELNNAKKEINLNSDLENKKEIDQSDKKVSTDLAELLFQYIDHEYTYYGTTEHAYSKELVGENYSIPLKAQFGNRLVQDEYIDFAEEKNVNNLKLEDAYNSLALITKTFGQYGLSDVYGMDIDKTEGIETLVISYNEMMDICNGKTITKNGKTLTKDSFDTQAQSEYTKVGNVNIGNNIKAIKYTDSADNKHEKYMFISKDKIYYISVPTDQRLQKIVNDFLGSLTEQ